MENWEEKKKDFEEISTRCDSSLFDKVQLVLRKQEVHRMVAALSNANPVSFIHVVFRVGEKVWLKFNENA